MGKASKIVLVIFRVWQLISSAIVLGILAYFLRQLSEADAWNDGRIIYGIVVAAISLVFAIVFIAPFMYAFMGFPMDFALFVMWLVLFCLLATRTHACNTRWFWNYWGYYWGGWWRRPVVIVGPDDNTYTGCGYWRAVLAFSFQALFTYFVTAILGAYVVSKYWSRGRKDRKAGTAATTGRYQTSQVGPPMQTGDASGYTPGMTTAANATTAGQPRVYV